MNSITQTIIYNPDYGITKPENENQSYWTEIKNAENNTGFPKLPFIGSKALLETALSDLLTGKIDTLVILYESDTHTRTRHEITSNNPVLPDEIIATFHNPLGQLLAERQNLGMQ